MLDQDSLKKVYTILSIQLLFIAANVAVSLYSE